MKYSNILQTIGNTPIVQLKRYSNNPNVKIYAKLEGSNPGGSIKDRIALYMILDARRKKILNTSKTIIEATSGNTGIGIAMISAFFGYKFIAVMPKSVSIERRKLLKAYGAEIILTDGAKGTNYSIEVKNNIIKQNKNKFVQLNQFNNILNVTTHFKTTGKEICFDVPNISHFVAGMGTGGTLMGVGKRLKQFNPKIQIVGIEPIPLSTIQGLRNMKAYKPSIYKESYLDNKLNILDDEIAFDLARDLIKKEGISVGISSGAALWGAIEISRKIKKGIIVTIFPDKADRYISTKLFSA